MITPRELQLRLTAKPFQPFVVFLTDGSAHPVPHPEFGWVFQNSFFVGEEGELPFGMDAAVRQLSILHISRIEPLMPAQPKPLRRKRKSKS